MSEVVFPILGTAFVVLVLLPTFALVAKAALVSLELLSSRGPLHGLRLRYLVLTSSSALPLAWLLSAAMHQAETGRSVVTCLFDHEAAALCFEPGLFLGLLSALLLWALAKELRLARGGAPSISSAARGVRARIARIVAEKPELGQIANLVDATDDDRYAIGVHGFLSQRIVVGIGYASSSSDDELACALGHEAEHVRARDPLRYLVLSLALAVNPFGRWLLEPHAASWIAAREAHCDREAVIRGAGPLALAQALVRAARPGRAHAALGAQSASLLRLRVEMLLAFEERAPARCCHREPASIAIVAALLFVAALLPHHAGTAALDALHFGTEHALHYFWR